MKAVALHRHCEEQLFRVPKRQSLGCILVMVTVGSQGAEWETADCGESCWAGPMEVADCQMEVPE